MEVPLAAKSKREQGLDQCPHCQARVHAWSIRSPAYRWPEQVAAGQPYVLVTRWTCLGYAGHRGKTVTPYGG